MKAKKYFVMAVICGTVLLAFAAGLYGYVPWQKHDAGGANISTAALTGAGGKFGRIVERVLPAPTTGALEILNLETGRLVPERVSEQSDQGSVIMAWIRTNGLDLSSRIWPTGAACVTHNMTLIPVESKSWKKITEDELRGNPALSSTSHSPRRMLLLAPDRPDTYAFRTEEGTLGLLQIVGLSQNRQGIKIRYKLVNPVQPVAVAQ